MNSRIRISVALAATALAATGCTPTDGDQVLIGSKTYTFKTTLGTTEGQVKINASAANALTNLKAAIDHTGAAIGSNADYYCAAAHTQVQGGALGASTLVVTALDAGTAGNAIATTDPVDAGSKLSWGAATLASGADTISMSGTFAEVTLAQPAQRVSIGEYPSGNASWSRTHRLTDSAIQCVRSAIGVGLYLTSWSKVAYAIERTLSYIPRITTQPSAASCVNSSTAAVFTVVASSEATATYQWQYSANGTTLWAKATGTINGCAYTNDTTASLTCTPTTVGQTGYYHRCHVTNANGTTTTSAVILTIT